MLNYRNLMSSRRKGSLLVSDASSPPLVPSGTVENDRFVYLKGDIDLDDYSSLTELL